jgi:hypothetical protein
MQIDLRQIETVVYTCEPVGLAGAAYHRRRLRISTTLDSLGYSNWRFFRGEVTEPYWQGLRDGHAALIGSVAEPLLILEDDVSPRDASTVIKIPDGCQVAYLGGSRGGSWRGVLNAFGNGRRLQRRHKWAYEPIDSEWVRSFGMWNAHAILWLDRIVRDEVAGELQKWRGTVDQYLAEQQYRWYCCLRRVPLWWQADGHHERDTWAYLD